MTRKEYTERIQLALDMFVDTLEELLQDGASLEEINDELMLEIYEQTGDSRRA